MKIGNIKIDTPVFLAPMAGYTDYPFRVLCKRSGAGVVYSEFVSADGIIRENIRTLRQMFPRLLELPRDPNYTSCSCRLMAKPITEQ